jgi:pyrroline-5-carboxylate reductase
MGIAILSGILSSLHDLRASSNLLASQSGTSTPLEELPSRLPTKFVACVRRPESAKKIKSALSSYLSSVSIVQNGNVKACQQADIILLGPKPYMVEDILAEPGMKESLKGKLLISICAGVTVEQIERYLYAGSTVEEERCTVVRAMPNTASGIRESMTVIATSNPPLPASSSSLITWIFKRIGDVVHLPASTVSACFYLPRLDFTKALCLQKICHENPLLIYSADGCIYRSLWLWPSIFCTDARSHNRWRCRYGFTSRRSPANGCTNDAWSSWPRARRRAPGITKR